tara:strand:- start:2224 stop:2925 length:702 start_codon:yes stop_codon:yes gene_type:complete
MQRSRGLAEGWNVQPIPLLPKISQVSVEFRPTMVNLLDGSLRQLLTIATGNPIKVAEIEAMLGPLSVEVQRQPNDLDVEETGTTYLENAELKATAAALRTHGWALADDSGLEVDGLNGAPGLFSARYADGNPAKIKRVLDELGPTPYRSACFRSTMVLSNPQGECVASAEGICWGELLTAPEYAGGGFESLLWVREANCTYGAMNTVQLSRLGSRGKAARALADDLRRHLRLN